MANGPNQSPEASPPDSSNGNTNPVSSPAAEPQKGLARAAPLFARAYPQAPELDILLAVFRTGNYAEVRRLAPQMMQQTKDPDVQKAIADLRKRIEPEPMAFYLFGLTLALLVFLTAWFYLHK